MATTEDALLLWVLHLELDKRDIPPCLRWPKRDESPQVLFVTWLADVYWFAKRNREHRPCYARWRGLFANKPASEKWHAVAIWVYRAGREPSHYHSKGLGLSDAQRQPLMTLLSNDMRGNRQLLHRLPELRDRIWLHAVRHPDRSGEQSPEATADRRRDLLRLFLLACRNRTLAARYHHLRSGAAITRQALTRHMEAVELATNLRLLSSR